MQVDAGESEVPGVGQDENALSKATVKDDDVEEPTKDSPEDPQSPVEAAGPAKDTAAASGDAAIRLETVLAPQQAESVFDKLGHQVKEDTTVGAATPTASATTETMEEDDDDSPRDIAVPCHNDSVLNGQYDENQKVPMPIKSKPASKKLELKVRISTFLGLYYYICIVNYFLYSASLCLLLHMSIVN
jgi:hypothetical protein